MATITSAGYDMSGNHNDWTLNNINETSSTLTTYDIMNDVPTLTDEDTANFCTLSPLSGGLAPYNANLSINQTAASWAATPSTFTLNTGKWYFESGSSAVSAYNFHGLGLRPVGMVASVEYCGSLSGSYGCIVGPTVINLYSGGVLTASLSGTYTSSSVFQCAVDFDAGKIWFGDGTSWVGGGNPSTGTTPSYTFTANTPLVPYISAYVSAPSVNFGQRSFKYTPPTGYKKLNTYNLPDSTIQDGSQYFETTTYTGDGTNNRTIPLGFTPDMVWMKPRNYAYYHNIMDSLRDNLLLNTNTTSADFDASSIGWSNTNVTTDGFIIDAGSNATLNGSGVNSVAWAWRGSDSSAVSNTDGTITSTVSANTDSGFSVVSYTGNSTNGATIGHGLGVAPKIVIVKNRDGGWQWIVDISNITGTTSDHLLLNSTAAKNSSNTYFSAKPTSTVFSVNGASYSDTGTSPYKYIAYCFADVEGFSKFGSYTGNGSADGPFIYTGFDVKFLLYKNVDAAISWVIYDNVRDPNGNPQSYYLLPNSSGAEGTTPDAVDFLSNGFKIRYANASINTNGQTHIYMAFAENPFKNSLAR